MNDVQNNDLNQAQLAAVQFDKNKPLIILAGAGSGKTKVLTHRAAYFVQTATIGSGDILLLTFTNKAAGEMMSRVNQLTGKGSTKIAGGTFHSFCLRLLRQHGADAGLPDQFSVFDESDQADAIKRAMRLVGVDPKTTKPGALLGAISDAKNNLVGPKDYATFARGSFQILVAKVYNVYQNLLTTYNGMDFDDLMINAIKILKDEQINRSVTDRFEYVLIDEYQDTNTAQYELTKLLAGRHRRLTVVGDAAQAIYSWRGANYKNLLYLKKDFPDITTLNLEQNYRSTQIILSAANEIISKNTSHPVLKLWTKNHSGDKVTLFQAESETDEANYIAEKIRVGTQTGKALRDFAILYRTNAQSRVIEEAFLHTGIPYVLAGGIRFYERKEIKDVLAYLRILVNPADEISRARAEKVGKNRLARLEGVRADIDPKTNTIDVLDLVTKTTRYLELFDQNDEEDLMRLENIKELRSVAMQFSNLAEFLQQITLTETEARGHKRAVVSGDAVTMTTIHAAKGLEFDTVYMTGMEEGLFPHSRSLMDNSQMEEERRLCYVGMTRAKSKLVMSYAQKRLYFGQRNFNAVSRFLAEVPEDLIDSETKVRKFSKVDQGWGFDENGEWRWKPEE